MKDFDNLYFWNTLNKTRQGILVWNKNKKIAYNNRNMCIKREKKQLGVFTTTREPTHSPKPPGLIRKPGDLTPVMVGDGSPPPKTDLGGSDGGFSSSKPNIPDLTDKTHERRLEFLDPFRFISIPMKVLVVFG